MDGRGHAKIPGLGEEAQMPVGEVALGEESAEGLSQAASGGGGPLGGCVEELPGLAGHPEAPVNEPSGHVLGGEAAVRQFEVVNR